MSTSPQSSSTATLPTTGHDREKDGNHEKDDTVEPADLSNGDLEKGNNAPQTPPAVLDWDGPDDPENPMNVCTFLHSIFAEKRGLCIQRCSVGSVILAIEIPV